MSKPFKLPAVKADAFALPSRLKAHQLLGEFSNVFNMDASTQANISDLYF